MHRNKKKSLLSASAIGLIASASICGYAGMPGHNGPGSIETLRYADERPAELKFKVKAKTVSSEGFLYEDFETATGDEPYLLPEGWTVTSTPGHESDRWRAGTISMDGSAMAGTSGIKYAFILSNGEYAHDAWAISPAVYMTGGTEYKIEFNSVILTFGSAEESFEVAVGSSPDAQSMTAVLGKVDDTNGDWQKQRFLFTPEESGEYYIGFHSNSPVASKDDAGTLIDDLKVYAGLLPVVGQTEPCEFGTRGHLDAPVKNTVEVDNRGSSDLELTLKSVSEGLMIEGLPLVIDRFETGSFDVTLTSAEIGDYNGEIVLATNDPLHPEVTVEVTARIEESRVTGFCVEDFESGGPAGWELPVGVVNTAELGGHDSSRCIYTTTYYSIFDGNKDGIGFTTHYVDMGDAPVFSFWYQLTDNSMFGGVGDPTDSERPVVKVLVSDDYGATWNKEYEISKDGNEPHVPSADYRQVKVDLSKYAGKRCRVRLLFNQTDASDVMAVMMNNIRVLVDDVAIGTPVRHDIKADFLHGNALVKPGEENVAKVLVANLGSEDVDSYNIELIDLTYDTVIFTFTGENLESGDEKTVELGWTVSEAGRHDLIAKVYMQGDLNEDNNESNVLAVDVITEDCTTVNFNQGNELRSSSYPLEFGNVETASQSIYTAGEIGVNKALITSVVFTSAMDSPFKGESFEILVGETEKEDFSDGVFVDPESLVKVFEGVVFFGQGVADVVIPFSEPYDYNGGNLIVMARKLGKEFVNHREFIVHETETLRSIQASSIEKGGLGEYPSYHNVFPSKVLPQMRLNLTPSKPTKVECIANDIDSSTELIIIDDCLYIRSSSEISQVNIANISGAEVLSLKAPGESIDVSSLPGGIYITTITTENGYRASYKIIKK